jgi:hypothetical protein
VTFANSSRNLEQVVDSYNQTSLLNDAQLHATDAAADQVQWVIGGQSQVAQGQTPAKFVGDAVYEEDFKKQLELLLATKDSAGNTVYTPASLTECPATPSQRSNYKAIGALGDVCREVTSTTQLTALNQFIRNYRTWLTTDTNFRAQVAANNVGGGLTIRNGDGAAAYQQMSASLDELKRLSVADYNQRSKEGTDSLNLSLLLAWIIFPLSLLLAEVGLLGWRRAF